MRAHAHTSSQLNQRSVQMLTDWQMLTDGGWLTDVDSFADVGRLTDVDRWWLIDRFWLTGDILFSLSFMQATDHTSRCSTSVPVRCVLQAWVSDMDQFFFLTLRPSPFLFKSLIFNCPSFTYSSLISIASVFLQPFFQTHLISPLPLPPLPSLA